jgi:hypothetical protein
MRIATSADMFGLARRVRSTPAGESSDRAAIPASAVLSNWADAQWTDGCQVDELAEFQPLTVMTMNHLYEIVVLAGHDGLVRIRGGQFFPEWRNVLLAGCSLGGSFLKLRGIYAGFRMELHIDGEVIITSPVQRLALAQLNLNGKH